MFIRKSKIKQQLIEQYQKGYDTGWSDSDEIRKQIIKEKNKTIKKLIDERQGYLSRSMSLCDTVIKIERIRNSVADVLGSLIKECDQIIHFKDVNDNYILKNEHKFVRVK